MEINELVNKIRFFRKRAGLSKRKLSIMVGRTEGYISNLENSRKFAPSFETLNDIADVCGITLEEFFCTDLKSYEQDAELRKIIQNAQTDKKDLALSVLKSR